MSLPLAIPSWMEGVAQFQENGFLKLLISDETGDDDNNDDDTAEHHFEAKVLRSTETLLKMLNPPPPPTTTTTPVVAKTQPPTEAAIEPSTKVPGDGGDCDCDDDAVANDENATTPTTSANVGDYTNIQPDDSSLNHLVRIRNLFDSIQAALADIQKMKQRDEVKKGERKKGGGRWNRDAGKLKSLEHRQNRLQEQLLSQQQQKEQESPAEEEEEQRMEATGQQQASEEQESFEEEQELEHELEKLNTEERQTPNEPLIRWVLTLNSIRALFPEILRILNHERRNDTKLKICSYKLSVASQGARATQCWLIGQRVFDVTSQKACKKIHQEMRGILESFVRDPQVVQQVMTTKSFFEDDDNNNFWTHQWLQWVSRETTIQPIPHPLHRLVEHSTLPAQTILEFAKQCDREYIIEPLALMGHQGSSEVQDRYVAAITTLHTTLSQLLTSRFRGARLSLYGSCMSNLSLGQSSDVDLSLYIPLAETTQRDFDEGRITPAKYEAQMKSLVFQVCRKLESTKNTFRDMQPIARARVPVVTGCFLHAGNPHSPDGSIKFDICFMNDIAVANSSLLHQYSLVDPRARALMLIVKKWTQDYEINSAKNRCISSYAWMNMVVFYLQSVGMLPNLQCPHLTEAVGLEHDPYWHTINSLKTSFLKWQTVEVKGAWKPTVDPDIPVTALLYGFFRFYTFDFLWSTYCISIRMGGKNLSVKSVFRNATLDFFSIEDPFETHDAYCPHDLSSPASELEQKKILDLLREAESYLRNVLITASVDAEVAGLWKKPIHSVVDKPENDNGNKQRQRNRGKGRNQRPPNEQRAGHQSNEESKKQQNGQAGKKRIGQQNRQADKAGTPNHLGKNAVPTIDVDSRREIANSNSPRGNHQGERPPRNQGRGEHPRNRDGQSERRDPKKHNNVPVDGQPVNLEKHVAMVREPSGYTVASSEDFSDALEEDHKPSIVNGFSKPPHGSNTAGRGGDNRRRGPGGRINHQHRRNHHRPKNAKPRGQENVGHGVQEVRTDPS